MLVGLALIGGLLYGARMLLWPALVQAHRDGLVAAGYLGPVIEVAPGHEVLPVDAGVLLDLAPMPDDHDAVWPVGLDVGARAILSRGGGFGGSRCSTVPSQPPPTHW